MKPQRMWAVRNPYGVFNSIGLTKRETIENEFATIETWVYFFKRGYRCVRVTVEEMGPYQEAIRAEKAEAILDTVANIMDAQHDEQRRAGLPAYVAAQIDAYCAESRKAEAERDAALADLQQALDAGQRLRARLEEARAESARLRKALERLARVRFPLKQVHKISRAALAESKPQAGDGEEA